jgi:hypothetical protein
MMLRLDFLTHADIVTRYTLTRSRLTKRLTDVRSAFARRLILWHRAVVDTAALTIVAAVFCMQVFSFMTAVGMLTCGRQCTYDRYTQANPRDSISEFERTVCCLVDSHVTRGWI